VQAAGDCPALTRLGWAIQSSWTNGVRLTLTRPICGTYGKHFAHAWLRVFSAPKQSPRPPTCPLAQTVKRFVKKE
jgi:hypothetical protein